MSRWFVFLLWSVMGCTTTLQPAPWIAATPGPGAGAVATNGELQIEARVNAWGGIPENLQDEVTPVLVTISNNSRQPVRIRYCDFQLASAIGQTFAALPPFRIEGSVTQRVTSLDYPPIGFGVAPYLSPYYPGMYSFYGPFAYDPFYYDRYYPIFVRVNLPTGDMLQKALPEGVLEPQGRLSGFLYFERVSDEVRRVDFRAEMINAQTNQQVAALSIPFVSAS